MCRHIFLVMCAVTLSQQRSCQRSVHISPARFCWTRAMNKSNSPTSTQKGHRMPSVWKVPVTPLASLDSHAPSRNSRSRARMNFPTSAEYHKQVMNQEKRWKRTNPQFSRTTTAEYYDEFIWIYMNLLSLYYQFISCDTEVPSALSSRVTLGWLRRAASLNCVRNPCRACAAWA